jgi:hypothetical protein
MQRIRGGVTVGAINYYTSDYITLGVKPYDYDDFANDADFMEEAQNNIDEYGGTIESEIYSYIQECYACDLMNVETALKHYDFYYFYVAIKYGYYEGFTIDIENNFSVAFDTWEDKQLAQKEITRLKEFLIECAGLGLVSCSPGWCTGYSDYKGTLTRISSAVREMREEVRRTPTWAQYNRGGATA